VTKLCCLAGVLSLMVAAASPAAGQDASAAGRIKVVSGTAFVVRQGTLIPAAIGQEVLEADGLRTGADGRVGVTLKDETRISLGPNSEARLDRFTYSPAESRFALVLQVMQGAAAYVSGRIAKLSPDSIRLETPSAIVGVRGTRVGIRVEAP